MVDPIEKGDHNWSRLYIRKMKSEYENDHGIRPKNRMEEH
jgi:hypothetical protein